MPTLHPNRLPMHRKKWALSQDRVAQLAGVGRSTITRAELGQEPPSFRAAIALTIIFGAELRELFPTLFASVEEAVIERAVDLDESVREDESAHATLLREFLRSLVCRVNPQEA